MKISSLNRLLLLLTGLLAAYQIAIAIDGLGTLAVASYTVGFGVLLVASLLILILGYEVLELPIVVVVSTLIPLALSLGLVSEFLFAWQRFYLAFCLLGFSAIFLTRLLSAPMKMATIVLALVHGVAGLVIFILPIVLALSGKSGFGFLLVGVGGGFIGIGGLFLSFLKAGSPILSREMILKILPLLLVLTTASFVAGFALR
ncbi:MAG: hypothetical protein ACOY16_04680 [Chloroflexota bacterium]